VQAQLGDAVQADPDAQVVADFLGQLLLLRNVPFVHLVPDARFLPVESIRFFYRDPNWLRALVDGALSVGLGTSLESNVQALLTQQLEAMAATAAVNWRADQLGQTEPQSQNGPTGGFLLRSALASGWPGLTVTGTLKGTPMPLLRLEHLGPNVLLALFNGVPDTVILTEPQEGLEFGVDDSGNIDPRTIASPKITTGNPIHIFDSENPAAPLVSIRPGGQRVLNIASDPNQLSAPATQPVNLLEMLAKALAVEPGNIGPADFAVQMVKGPEQLQFSMHPSPKPSE
jgi:hypothetical protein